MAYVRSVNNLPSYIRAYCQKVTNGNVSLMEGSLGGKCDSYLKCSKCQALLLLSKDVNDPDDYLLKKIMDDYLVLHTHLTEIVYKTVYVQGPEPKKVEVPKTLKQPSGRKFR